MKKLRNVTGSPITVSDVGITIAAGDEYTIAEQHYLLWAASSNVVTHIGNGDLVVNDGSFDLSISNGVDLIKGVFPQVLGLRDNVHNKPTVFSSFGHLQVSQETILGDYRFNLGEFENIYDTEVTGLGNYEIMPEGGTGLELHTGTSTNSSISVFSKATHYYQSGRGLKTKQSAIMTELTAGVVREWGLTCENNLNQVCFRQDGANLKIVVISNGVEKLNIDSADWDVPVTPDIYGHLYYIGMQWLGVGDLYFFYDEVLVHTWRYNGTSTDLSISTPDLRMFWAVENTTNATDVHSKFGCGTVISEGGNTAVRLDSLPQERDLGILNKSVLMGFSDDLEKFMNIRASELNELKVLSRNDVFQFTELRVQNEKIIELLEAMNRQLMIITGWNGGM